MELGVKSFLLTNGPVLRKRQRKTQKTYPFQLKALLGNFAYVVRHDLGDLGTMNIPQGSRIFVE
ncbi:MAG: hypothetical protein BA861_02790 [Desulfobacterales bacterium S3730MH5]|nr:MAG: hypothetical protein BA861_02790 [Desulfobacterales bacterium S3730MH5]